MAWFFSAHITFPHRVIGGITEFDRAMAHWEDAAFLFYLAAAVVFPIIGIRYPFLKRGRFLFFLFMFLSVIVALSVFFGLPYYYKDIRHLDSGMGG